MDRKQVRQERSNLLRLVLYRLISGLLVIGGILFALAGTFRYWQAWLFLAALAIPLVMTLIFLLRKDPALLEKRMNLKEPRKEQRKIVQISGLFMLLGFFLPGLDYRYQWSDVPIWVIVVSVIVFECSYAMVVTVFAQNSYASRVVEIQEGQQLIDTGLYAIIRHPMYSASIILYLSIPLILGSYYAVIPMALSCLEIIARIKDEEEMLKEGLAGYTAYTQRVKYRLFPYVW
ncbi:methyltransferase family protein [Trichococcus sp.]|uniref:methyltransferase family protein n=1 Tax=Trichococcus sp. TaxID=1985464 RepID=UPI003C7E4214